MGDFAVSDGGCAKSGGGSNRNSPNHEITDPSVFICGFIGFMDVAALERQLHAEGFRHTYTWQDGPGAHYPDH
ncbi:MAG: hypothetical protein ACRD5G_16975, partial [Candidatus Acidiferrales bacterium]